MLKKVFLSFVALLAIAAAATGPVRAQSTNTLTDTITREWTGVTGTSYQLWEDVVSPATDAVYAGCSAGGNYAIQLRSAIASPGASGIVTTTSGGKVASVTVVWNSNTQSGRTLQVYGKNSAYNSAADLYGGNAGTLLGTIVCGTSTSLTITGDYEYIGLRSQQSAMYLDEIRIEWIVPQQGGSSEPALYTVTLDDGGVDAGNWSITPAAAATDGVAEGTVVNISYGGTRKVKSVVATVVPAALPAATVATAPTATANVTAGSTTALVSAGTAEGGTMMYAVTTTNVQPASTADFSATIPTAQGRSAGTYYVWYYAKADAEHSDSEIAGPVSVTVTVATITVTINQSDWGEGGPDASFTKDGVTVSAGDIDPEDGNLVDGSFSTTLGNFTSIVVTSGYCHASGSGWSSTGGMTQTWSGTPASTVSFSGEFMGMGAVQTTIVCTIQPNN